MTIYEKTSALLKFLASKVEVGYCICTLNNDAGKWMAEHGVESTDWMYHPSWATKPFDGYICTSVNDVICHGRPVKYLLKEGDILCIDVGIRDKETGLCGDAAITVPVGEVANKDMRLLRYAKRALYVGIESVRAGVKVTEIGDAIQRFAWQRGYRVNKAFSGHAIGKEMHMKPYIPHFHELDPKYEAQFDGVLKEGDIICIEPMLTYGKDDVGQRLADGWTWQTRDHKNSAMFEHMVRVDANGCTVLTDHFDESLYEEGMS